MSWGAHDAESEAARLETIVLLLGSLASVRVNDARLTQIPPHERQQGTFDSLRAFLIGESQRQPVVVVLDDLQWIDATSEALLNHLVGSIGAHRLMLIACGRPEYQPSWGRHSAVVPLALKPLDGPERRCMIDGSLHATTLPPELVTLASERSEGNPFFLEELLKTLVERSPIAGDGGAARLAVGEQAHVIPTTVEDLITARIDRLDEPLKRVLQIAAVIGRDFGFDLLRAVAGTGDDLRQRLIGLAELELIREISIFPAWTFSFKSSLAHEVAYRTLLAGRRRELHARVARAIESLAADHLEESYEIIAYHLSRSTEAEAAARYLILAGDKAVRHFAITDARRYFDEAADKLQRLPESMASRYAIELNEHRQRLVTAEAGAASA